MLSTQRRNNDYSLKGGVPPDNSRGVIDAKIKVAAITAARALRRDDETASSMPSGKEMAPASTGAGTGAANFPRSRAAKNSVLRGGGPPDNPRGVIDAKIKAAAITAARARRR